MLEREVEDSKGILMPALRALAVVSALSIQRKSKRPTIPSAMSSFVT